MLITFSYVGLEVSACSCCHRISSSKWFVFQCLLLCSALHYFGTTHQTQFGLSIFIKFASQLRSPENWLHLSLFFLSFVASSFVSCEGL
jgi:hypothetical protein